MSRDNVMQGKLTEMIKYQADSVISKTLIDNEGGTLTLFAFAKGSSISEHTASHDAMAQVLDGTIKFVVAGEEYEIPAGEFLIMPADLPHSLAAPVDAKMLLTMIE